MADFHDAASKSDVSLRRRRTTLAGHTGDEGSARTALNDPDAAVRAAAIGALARLGHLDIDSLRAALSDPSPEVRRRATEVAAVPAVGEAVADQLVGLLSDPDALVVETVAATLGELPARPHVVDALCGVALGHDEPLCRESAVAALGALGDPAGLPAILKATGDRPAIRRRAVIALAPFEGPEIDAALNRALEDRDWQVRQAAEDQLGREAN